MNTTTFTTTSGQKVKREAGERVQLGLNIEQVEVKEMGDGILEAIVTTSSMDRHNEDIVTDGIDIDNYMTNPVVLYGHDYQSLPIGKTLKITKMKNKIKARFQLAVEELPFAQDVYRLIKGGYLNAVSIGGVVREWSEDYRSILKMEMVEFSIVPIPANGEALITARSLEEATGKSFEQLRQDFQAFTRNSLVDRVKDMDDDSLIETIKTLESLLVTLKGQAQAHAEAKDEKVKKRKLIRMQVTAKAIATESNRTVRTVKLIRLKESTNGQDRNHRGEG